MTELEMYELVNNADSLRELASVIRKISVDGVIKGRNYFLDAERMAVDCTYFGSSPRSSLTRKYGIRQQAIMLLEQNKVS